MSTCQVSQEGTIRFVMIIDAASAQQSVTAIQGALTTLMSLQITGFNYPDQSCVFDLPVGEGLQDHLSVSMMFNMSKLVVPYRPFNPGLYPASLAIGYVNLNKSKDYPAYQSINFQSFPNIFMGYCGFVYNYADFICNSAFKTSVNTQMIYTVIHKQRFKSRGRVILKSNNFKDDPLIYTGYYSVKEDLEDHARCLQDYIRIVNTTTFRKLGGEFKDPKLPKCGKYNKDDLKYWKCYVQYMVASLHQYSSTCPMGTVVDPRLRVYGVKRLRVVDASVMPNPTAGGTLGPTIIIGEKAADMIKEDRNCKIPLYNCKRIL